MIGKKYNMDAHAIEIMMCDKVLAPKERGVDEHYITNYRILEYERQLHYNDCKFVVETIKQEFDSMLVQLIFRAEHDDEITYWKVTGWDDSTDSPEYDWTNIMQVQRVNKTITVYE